MELISGVVHLIALAVSRCWSIDLKEARMFSL